MPSTAAFSSSARLTGCSASCAILAAAWSSTPVEGDGCGEAVPLSGSALVETTRPPATKATTATTV